MRLIDADALIAEIEKRRRAAKTLTGVDMVMLTKDAPTVDTDNNVLSKWISVKERLPELKRFDEDGDTWLMSSHVLVATNKGVTIGFYEDDLDPKFKPGWNDREHGERIRVTHWMELPERPKK